MRLIDADALIANLKKDPLFKLVEQYGISGVIEAQLTVDAVPVIRCKDCKHYYEKEWVVGGGSYTTCWYQTIANAQPNDFCSRAERKTDGNG